MNISSVNCTPIKPQVSFGDGEEAQYRQLAAQTMALSDSFTPKQDEGEPKTKSPIGTLASLGTAVLVTYAGGKFAANKFANLFKGTAGKISGALVKAADGKLAGKAETFLASKKGKVAELATKALNGAKAGLKSPNALANIAGAGAVAAFVPQLAKVDKNADGIPDIAQRQVNAYEGAMDKMTTISQVVSALS